MPERLEPLAQWQQIFPAHWQRADCDRSRSSVTGFSTASPNRGVVGMLENAHSNSGASSSSVLQFSRCPSQHAGGARDGQPTQLDAYAKNGGLYIRAARQARRCSGVDGINTAGVSGGRLAYFGVVSRRQVQRFRSSSPITRGFDSRQLHQKGRRDAALCFGPVATGEGDALFT